MKWSNIGVVVGIGLGVGALALRIWLGNQELAEQERQIAKQKLALAKQLADLARQEEEVRKELEDSPVKQGLQKVGIAYLKASNKLGRPPKAAEELRPFLEGEDDLLSPRDGQPFAVSWGASTVLGARLAWERTPDKSGGRYVLGPLGVRYETAKDFNHEAP